MYKHKLFLLPVAWLLAFMALACAPPDDNDDNGAPSSGPTINNAIYDFATALLTVQGTDLSPTEAQIQTIVVDGVALSSYTADDDATGLNSNGLEQGKYRLKGDGTALWLRLTDQHKAALNGKVGSNGLKKGLLTSTGAWAGLDTAKDLEVSNVPENKQSKVSDDNQPSKQTEETEQDEQAEEVEDKQSKTETEDQSPKQAEQTEEVEDKQSKTETEDQSLKQAEAAITRATYNVATGVLVITGTNLPKTVDDWDFSKLRFVQYYNLYSLSSYTLPQHSTTGANRATGSKASATSLTITLSGRVKAEAESDKILSRNGLTGKHGGAYNLEAAAGFAGGRAEDTSNNPITVSGYVVRIDDAYYYVNTGLLVINGQSLPSKVEEWDFSKLTLVSGDGKKRFTLPRHATTGANRATGSGAIRNKVNINLSGSVKTEADRILVKNGKSDDAGAYNLEAAAGFAGDSAEDTSNPITVSGYTSQIDNVYYFSNSGQLRIYGSRLPTAVEGWDFSKLTLVSGDGKKKYTLPQHSTAGENTATGSAADATYLSIILSGSVKAEAEKILVKVGLRDANGSYNLEAAAEFVTGSPADPTTSINVIN